MVRETRLLVCGGQVEVCVSGTSQFWLLFVSILSSN